jgi:cell division protein ZapA (FtsZ GTPase activity inhibitor)
VIDSERQLSEKIVDKDVRNILERSDYMTLEHLFLINAILTLPETSLEKEY